MIYLNKEKVSEDDFVSLLEKSKKVIEDNFIKKETPRSMSGVEFENEVYIKMVEAAIGSIFEGHIEQTGAHAFPDIVAKKLYGVEVKMTVSDKWISVGNSVLETTRLEDIKTIYMVFGKFGNNFEIKYRKYQDCLYDIGVTHSPRYKIDMNLPAGKSIFDKMGVSYESFRRDGNSIKKLKEYYHRLLKEGEELWWIDSTSDEKSFSPVIKSFKLLDEDLKSKFICEAFILFPEIFGNSSVKFERVAAYLITEYNSVSSSLRDIFTAGGKAKIKIKTKDILVSKLVYNFFINALKIKEAFEKIPKETLLYYWNVKKIKDPIQTWKALIVKNVNIAPAEKVIIFDILNQNLHNQKSIIEKNHI